MIPAVYFPILFMLIGLVFRGVAFEFRHLSTRRRLWDRAFFAGSLIATFSQGIVLGTFVQGLPVEGRAYVGSSLGWSHAFRDHDRRRPDRRLLVCWAHAGWCSRPRASCSSGPCRKARQFAVCVAAFVAMVSVWTPILQTQIRERWFGGTHLFVPAVAGAACHPLRCLCCSGARLRLNTMRRRSFAALGIFAMAYLGLGISIFPMVVPYTFDLWQAAASPKSQAFLQDSRRRALP